MTDTEGGALSDPRAALADRLTAIIESRMSRELAWLDDDGQTVTMQGPEFIAAALLHLVETGDVVSGLRPLAERGVLLVTEQGLAAKVLAGLGTLPWTLGTSLTMHPDEASAAIFAALSAEVTE